MRERDGPGKLRSFWEQTVYRVVERKGEGPVYVIEPERGGERRTVHRNLLFHCSEELEDPSVVEPKKKKKSSRCKVQIKQNEPLLCANEESNDENSENDEYETLIRKNPPRTRKRTSTLNYNKLGTPSISLIQTNKQSPMYKAWLETLWMIGFITDHIVKQSRTQQKNAF